MSVTMLLIKYQFIYPVGAASILVSDSFQIGVKHQLVADARGVITPLDSPVPDSKIVGDLESACYAIINDSHRLVKVD
ncbi:MAG: hypothetical protein ACW97P_13560 [Candidatus Hodarchaeales archaeon]|jgi:hypothetical protein